MKAILGGLVLSLFVTMTVVPADAQGCIKGAVVGGAAGHIAGHHGLMGAAAGCVCLAPVNYLATLDRTD